MKKFMIIVLVSAVGAAAYIAGSKAGRARYKQISGTASAFWNDPEVRKLRARVEKRARKAARKLG